MSPLTGLFQKEIPPPALSRWATLWRPSQGLSLTRQRCALVFVSPGVAQSFPPLETLRCFVDPEEKPQTFKGAKGVINTALRPWLRSVRSQAAISPFQGLQPDGRGSVNPGRWPIGANLSSPDSA